MCNNNNNEDRSCIKEILKVIFLLQQSVCPGDECLDSCDRGFLGQNCSTLCNTRPVVIYTCSSGSTPLSMPTTKTGDMTTAVMSNVFRVEKLDGNCATFRVLANNTEEGFPYISTNSLFTINLDCVCSLRCLDDTFVDIC